MSVHPSGSAVYDGFDDDKKMAIQKAFSAADTNADGTLCVEEIQSLLSQENVNLSLEDCRELMEVYTEDGKMRLHEFQKTLDGKEGSTAKDMTTSFANELRNYNVLSDVAVLLYLVTFVVLLAFGFEFAGALWFVIVPSSVAIFCVVFKRNLTEKKVQYIIYNSIPKFVFGFGLLAIPYYIDYYRGGYAIFKASANTGSDEQNIGWNLCHAIMTDKLEAPIAIGEWHDQASQAAKEQWLFLYQNFASCLAANLHDEDCVQSVIARAQNYSGIFNTEPIGNAYVTWDDCQYMRSLQYIIKTGTLLVHGTSGGLVLMIGLALIYEEVDLFCLHKPIPTGTRMHRLVGSVYVVLGIICSSFGMASVVQRKAPPFHVACISGYVVLFWVTLIGAMVSFYACKTRELMLHWHRRFFVCNYLVFCGAVSLRIWYLLIFGARKLLSHDISEDGMPNFNLYYNVVLFLPIPTQAIMMLFFLKYGTLKIDHIVSNDNDN